MPAWPWPPGCTISFWPSVWKRCGMQAPRSLSLANRTDGHPLIGKGRTAPSFFASCAHRYFHEYGIGRETLAKVAVKNHHNGTLNPKAHLQREITLEDVLKVSLGSRTLSILDSTTNSDGAAAAIVTRADLAKRFRSDYILVKGMGLSVGTERNIFDPEFSFLSFKPTQRAAQMAYQQAGIKSPRSKSISPRFTTVLPLQKLSIMRIWDLPTRAKDGD